jgi:hypothetical protein
VCSSDLCPKEGATCSQIHDAIPGLLARLAGEGRNLAALRQLAPDQILSKGIGLLIVQKAILKKGDSLVVRSPSLCSYFAAACTGEPPKEKK